MDGDVPSALLEATVGSTTGLRAESGSTACTPATCVAHHGNAKLLGNSAHANQDYDLTTSSMWLGYLWSK